MRIWQSWDEEERAAAVRIAGLCVAALTLFIFISTFSYLFHWREDMSLLGDPDAMQAGRAVGNAAGKLGFRTGHLLVCDLFGLGSFSLLIILTAVSVRLLAHRWPKSLVKTALIAVFGAFLSSVILAFIGKRAGLDLAFGGGLGGHCGAAVVSWAENLFGPIVTGLFLVILTAAFLFFASKRFNRWFASIGQPKRKPAVVPGEEIPDQVGDDNGAVGEVIGNVGENPDQAGEDVGDSIPGAHAVIPGADPESPAGNEIPDQVRDDADDILDSVPDDVFGVPQGAVRKRKDAAAGQPDAQEGNFEIVADNGLEAEQVEDLKPIDNRLDPPDGLPKYQFPSLDLLESYSSGRREVSTEELTRNNNKIRAALALSLIHI